MPWFRVDDGFDTHPKVLAIPRAHRLAAVGLWTSMGVWCAKHLTDGRFASHMVEEKGGTQTLARRLVTAGLWVETEDGYAFHEWKEQQPTREQVLAERAAAKERMRAARAKAKEKAGRGTPGSGDVRPNSDRTSPDVRIPRPDPTRPDQIKAASASTSPPQDDDPTPPPPEAEKHDQPPGPIAILAAKMARHSVFLRLRWDGVPTDKADRLIVCIDQLGDDAMVSAALKAVRPTDPPTFGTAFLGTWEALATARETGRHLRVIETTNEPGPTPAAPEVRAQAASAARARIRPSTPQEGQ